MSNFLEEISSLSLIFVVQQSDSVLHIYIYIYILLLYPIYFIYFSFHCCFPQAFKNFLFDFIFDSLVFE